MSGNCPAIFQTPESGYHVLMKESAIEELARQQASIEERMNREHEERIAEIAALSERYLGEDRERWYLIHDPERYSDPIAGIDSRKTGMETRILLVFLGAVVWSGFMLSLLALGIYALI